MKKTFGQAITPLLLQLVAILCLALVSGAAYAQSFGSIVGNVTDQTGAAVPGATITVTNLARNDKRVERSNGEGSYRIANLLPGRYREVVQMPGFKEYVRVPIEVDVETAVRIDVPLPIGANTEVVEVTSQTPLLQTDSATLQDVVDGKTVQEMPLNGKNVENLIALTPGVVAQGSTANSAGSNQSAGHTNSTGWNNYQIGGGQPGSAAQYLDGAPTSGLGGNTIFLIPNQDSVGEFRVATADVSPEFGRFGGGVVNFTSKGGGNDWHGSAYEYFRNKVLNAATYFGKQAGQPKASYNQNQFGGTLGGHIIKDKLFFFGNYEQYKIISGATFTALVPTAAERMGDFSADPAIYDPLTSVLTGSSTSPVTRTQISCAGVANVICPNRIDPTANEVLNVLSYYPLPNVSGQAGYNFAHTVSPGVESKQGGIRLDYNLSQKQRLFARYTQWNLGDIPLNQYGNVTGGSGSQQITHDGVFGDTYTFSQKLIGDVRFSYGRGFSDDLPPTLGADLSVFGPAFASLSSQVSARVYPTFNPSGYGAFRGMSVYDTSYRNTFDLAPSASYQLNRHSLKFGADFRFLDYNYFAASNASGGYNTDAGFTSSNGLTSGNGGTGNSIASLLLGYISSAGGMGGSSSIGTAIEVGQYSWYKAFYIQDTWQAARNLTVDGGVRYELPGAWFERRDRADVLLPNAANPLGNGTTGGLFLVNSPQWGPRSTEEQKYSLFSPRLGFVYSPRTNTSVRAGYSLIYLPLDTYDGAAPANDPFVSAVTNMVTSSPSNPYIPTNTLSDPFPAGGVTGTVQQQILQPVGRSQSYLNSLVGLSISGPIPQIRYPYSQQWTASVQQQFPGDTLMQLAYIGNRGTFLPQGSNYQTGSSNNLNQLPDQDDALGNGLYTQVANPFAGLLNPTGPLNGPTITTAQSLLRFPQYQNVSQTNAKGDSIYHGMIVSLRKRLHGGGEINGNYTWAKLIGDVPGTPFSFAETGMINIGGLQDYTNPRGDRTELNTDVRNRFVTSFVYPLPIGRGQRFFANTSGVAGGFVNGWGTNGIVTFQSGYHLSVSGGDSVLGQFGAGTVRPDYVSGCEKKISGSSRSKVGEWFNTACFGGPANIFSFGNEPRVDSAINAAGIANYDFSVSKDTGLTEHVKLQLKAEFFNLFNRVQFAPPATQLGPPTFGTVTDIANQPRQIQLSGRIIF